MSAVHRKIDMILASRAAAKRYGKLAAHVDDVNELSRSVRQLRELATRIGNRPSRSK